MKTVYTLFGWCQARQCYGTATARPCPGKIGHLVCTCPHHGEAERALEAIL